MNDLVFTNLCQYGRRPVNLFPTKVRATLQEDYHSDPRYRPRSRKILKNLLHDIDPSLLARQDCHGNTVLHYFAKWRDVEAVKMLIENSDLSILGIRNHRQQTPLDRAIQSGRSETKAYLLQLDRELRALLDLLESNTDDACTGEHKVEVRADTWSRCMSRLISNVSPPSDATNTPQHTPQPPRTPLTSETVIITRSPGRGINVKTPTGEYTLQASSTHTLLAQLSDIKLAGATSPSGSDAIAHVAKSRRVIDPAGRKPTCAVRLFKS